MTTFEAVTTNGRVFATVALDDDGELVVIDAGEGIRHEIDQLQREKGWSGRDILERYLGAGYDIVREVST